MSIYTPKREKRAPHWVEARRWRRFCEQEAKKNEERIQSAMSRYLDAIRDNSQPKVPDLSMLPAAGAFH